MAVTKSLMYSRVSSSSGTGTGLYKRARIGAFRINFFGPKSILSVNSTLRTRNFDNQTWEVTEHGAGQARTLRFEAFGFTPAVGQTVILGAGAITNRLFKGKITAVQQVRGKLNQGRVVFTVTAVDWTFDLDAILVTARYTSASGTDIAEALIALASGFTGVHIEAGLDTVDEIVFTMTPLPQALQQLADRIGAYWYVDEDQDLHFYTSETWTTPETLTSSNRHVRNLTYAADIDGLRNRVWVEGMTSPVSTDVDAGSTTLPIEDSEAFASSATNYAKLADQILTYTGKNANAGFGSEVSGVPQSPSAPSAAVVGGAVSGGVLGQVRYKVLYRVSNAHSDVSDDSETSAASGAVTVSAVSAPSSAPSPTVSTSESGNVAVGAYRYKVTYGTSLGETLASSATGSFSVPATSAPGAPSVAVASGTSGNVAVGSHLYKVTYETANGETALGSHATATITAVSAPASGGSGAVANASAGGNLGAGIIAAVYNYHVTYITAAGETLPSSSGATATINLVGAPGSSPSLSGTTGGSLTTLATYRYVVSYVTAIGETNINAYTSHTLTGSNNRIDLTSIPTSGNGRVTKRRIYRSLANDTSGFYYLVTTINDNSTTTYSDTTADASLGFQTSASDPDTTGYDQVNLTSLPTSGDGRVTQRKIYRTEANGATYKLLTTINDNSTTSYTDNTADYNLGDPEPIVDTSGGGQINLTSIPTSSDGRVLRRKIYRAVTNEPSDSGTYYYLATLNDNSTTSYTDNKADASLGEASPNLDTSGGGRISLASIPTSASARVTRRVLYRTKAGGSIYYRLASIPDNATTTFVDNKADENLGDGEPAIDESGGGKVTVTIPVGPAGTTGRKIFRTEAGGTVYKFLATVNDNSTTTYTDAKEDADLGDADPQESKVRTLSGSTTLPVKDLSQFPASGWAHAGSQVFRYTGRAASSGVGNLTGIPASGNGSLTKDVTYGTEITSEPFLTGIPSSGAGSILYAVVKGASCGILEMSEDGTSQGTYGVRTKFVGDRRLTRSGAQARGTAEVSLLKDPRVKASITSTDPKLRAGKPLVINVTEWSLSATVTVQAVTIRPGTSAADGWPQPVYQAQLASRSIEDLMSQLRIVRDHLAR